MSSAENATMTVVIAPVARREMPAENTLKLAVPHQSHDAAGASLSVHNLLMIAEHVAVDRKCHKGALLPRAIAHNANSVGTVVGAPVRPNRDSEGVLPGGAR